MTLLFGTLVIFSSIFAAFLLLCFFWQYRRAQRRVVVLEYDETIGTYKSVPKMWEVWTQHEPGGSQRHWESFRVSRAMRPPPLALYFCDLLKTQPKMSSRYLQTLSVLHVSIMTIPSL